MSTVYTIYRATNIITQKVYIGFDSSWPKRKGEHRSSAKRGEPYKFYNAIRKYGWDTFIWEVIYQSLDYDHCLGEMEPYFIVEHNSLADGYNGNAGGMGGPVGAAWWNNGVDQAFTQVPPDASYVKGRLAFNNVGAAMGAEVNRNRAWINNGVAEMMVNKDLAVPLGWAKGRLNAFNGMDRSRAKGTHFWNNGIDDRMSIDCPGPGWVRGRLATTQKARFKYNQDPKLCHVCSGPIPYDRREYRSCSEYCSTAHRKKVSSRPRKRQPTHPR